MSDRAVERARRTGRLRRLVYLTAAFTGLRRSELVETTWADVDLEASTLRVRVGTGKARREDHVPLHPQLRDELAAYKPKRVKASDRLFPSVPTIRTFDADLERARSEWIEEAGDDAEERQRRQRSDFLAKHDQEGRVANFHALRTSLGTALARHGVAPQLAQRIMRHADYRTTLSHYTVLGIRRVVLRIVVVGVLEHGLSLRLVVFGCLAASRYHGRRGGPLFFGGSCCMVSLSLTCMGKRTI